MRIAFVCDIFVPLSETFLYERVISLARQGHDVHVIAKRRDLADQRPYHQITILKRPGYLRRAAGHLRSLQMKQNLSNIVGSSSPVRPAAFDKTGYYYNRQLRDVLARIDPDFVHAEFGPAGVLVAPVAHQLRLPLVVFMHAHDITKLPREEKWRTLYSRLWSEANLIMAPSEFMRGKLLELGAPPELVTVQHNGIDLEKWEYSDPARRFDGRRVVFLHVGRLLEKKGPVQTVRAFAKCHQKLQPDLECQLVICGEGQLESDLRAQIKTLGIQGSVLLLGACSNQQVHARMNEAHIVVQHSVTAKNGDMEGLPVSLTEAAAVGLPIISTFHSGIPEIVKHKVSGYLVEENDIDGMAERMIELAKAPEKWSTFGAAGRVLVEKEFEQAGAIKKYISSVKKSI